MSHNIVDDADTNMVIATVAPASEADAQKLLGMPVGEDTRSTWQWVRLRSGELMLAVFPRADVYLEFSDAAVCDIGE